MAEREVCIDLCFVCLFVCCCFLLFLFDISELFASCAKEYISCCSALGKLDQNSSDDQTTTANSEVRIYCSLPCLPFIPACKV